MTAQKGLKAVNTSDDFCREMMFVLAFSEIIRIVANILAVLGTPVRFQRLKIRIHNFLLSKMTGAELLQEAGFGKIRKENIVKFVLIILKQSVNLKDIRW